MFLRWVAVGAILGAGTVSGCSTSSQAAEVRSPAPVSTAASPVAATPKATAVPRTRSTAPAPTIVPSAPVRTSSPVPLHTPATVRHGLEVRLVSSRSVSSTGTGAGEIAGRPAVVFTLAFSNTGHGTQKLDHVLVTASYGADATPASPDDSAGSVSPGASIAAGATVHGSYVFLIPTAARSRISLRVATGPSDPVVELRGSVSP